MFNAKKSDFKGVHCIHVYIHVFAQYLRSNEEDKDQESIQ